MIRRERAKRKHDQGLVNRIIELDPGLKEDTARMSIDPADACTIVGE